MKTKTFVMVSLVALIMASCMPMTRIAPTETATPLKIAIPTSTFTLVPTATLTKTPMPTLTPYPSKGACPLDLSQEKVDIFALFKGADHPGLDIAAPMGTSHFSPGDCTVLYFYVDDNGGEGVQLRCANLPSVDRISLHHVDFSQHNYETLDYYGIPKDEVFNDDGTVRTGSDLHVTPRSNLSTSWGGDLHIYSGNSGSSLPHTHVNVWVLVNGELEYRDPLEFLDCHE